MMQENLLLNATIERKIIRLKQNSLFITVFHKVKYISEKKNRVMVMQIENITKPLY